MSAPRVLCLGEILLDNLADQPASSISEVQSWTAYPGGAPANVACALGKLGTTAGFVGCLGQDQAGKSLVQVLEQLAVDRTGVQFHPTAPTREVYVLRSATGDRSFAGFNRPDPTCFADAHLQAAQFPVQLFAESDYLVLGTLELAYPDSQAAVERALQLADQYYLKIVVDVNWRPVFWTQLEQAPRLIQAVIRRADFLKLSQEEAEWLFQTTDPAVIAGHLDQLEGVLVTFGEAGCAYYLNQHVGKIPAFSVQVVDTTGAGDSFLAGLIHQLCQRGISSLNDPQVAHEIVTYASAVGALTTMNPGAIAAQPTAEQVRQFLQSQP